ncbi:hypothetical protein [Peribacillus frigoritolerans]|uniref:hypothetical protein n=1 Tax=Peribacillus frigoritolerans TaxID=450367 RepID=UPI0009E501A5
MRKIKGLAFRRGRRPQRLSTPSPNRKISRFKFERNHPESTRGRDQDYQQGTANGKRVQALAGVKNHAVVQSDCHLEKSVQGIIGAAFGSS